MPDSPEPNPTVLVVDDDKVMQSFMRAVLESLGYRPAFADSGEEALAILKSGGINLVITDLMMPGLSGRDLCRRVRDEITDRYVYLVMLTARDDANSLVQALEAGADDFISKPPNLDQLRVRLDVGRRIVRLERQLEARNRHLDAALAEVQRFYEVIDNDVRNAGRLLRRLIPPPDQLPGLSFDWLFRPSSTIGGDMLNVVTNPTTDLTVFYQIDVVGHGIPAALLTFMLQTLISGVATRRMADGADQSWVDDPLAVAKELNRRCSVEFEDDQFFTMAYGVMNRRTGRGRLVQAGHPSPLIWRAATGGVEEIGNGGMAIGMFADAAFASVDFHLAPGDRLVLYSDGVTDCENAGGVAFGTGHLKSVLQANSGQTLSGLVAAFDRALIEWRAGTSFSDDVSILVIEHQDFADDKDGKATSPHQAGRFPASLEAVRQITRMVVQALPPGIHPARRAELELGVAEAATNIVKHGDHDPTATAIEVDIMVDGMAVTVILRDHNRPFDPAAIAPPLPDLGDMALEALPESGMGLALIHALFDRITYAHIDGMNRLTLFKQLG